MDNFPICRDFHDAVPGFPEFFRIFQDLSGLLLEVLSFPFPQFCRKIQDAF